MRIVHILAPAPYGGLERVVQALAVGHARRGHRMTVAAIVAPETPEGHPFCAAVRESGVSLEVIRVRGRDYAGERAALRTLLLRLQPDVVHTHGYRPDVLDAPVARRLGLPTVTTVHGFTGGGVKNRAYEWLQRRAFRRFGAVVAVSRVMAEELVRAGVPRRRVRLVPNAWAAGEPPLARTAARAALGLSVAGWYIGFAGRLSREKGADVLVEALAHLRDLPVDACVLGGGPEGERLKARAHALGVSERIHWQGTVPAAQDLLGAFDVFVLSSRTEGTPIVLFEAIAAGVPVIASAVGGVPDVVGPAEALLVRPEDPAALAGAVRACHGGAAAAAERATAAMARLTREFSVAPWLDAYENLYRATLRPQARRAAGP